MKIFITGAAGYIGGSIAEKLIVSGHEVTGLARSEEQVPPLKTRGIAPVVGTLDDPEILSKAAQAADAVINAASADHAGSVITLVTALERSGKLLIHTTGSSIVADHADGEYSSSVALTDDSYFEPVPFRRPRVDMNRYVRQAAIEKGIRSIVICPAMIYGTGRGSQPNSDQIPKLIELSRHVGAGVYFGKGLNRYSNVHIDDLVDLYLIVMEKAPGGSFFFAENGNNSFKEIAEMISDFLGLGGKTASLPMEDIILRYGQAGRLGVGSNSFVSAVNARRLGWAPTAPSLADWLNALGEHRGQCGIDAIFTPVRACEL
jgi:nucleoside-diphosphate-sugar epimerase